MEEEETLLESVIYDCPATFTIYLGDRRVEYQPDEFLQACWTTGLDTPCSICNKEFDLAVAPPVRLLSLHKDFHKTDPLTRVLPPLIVTNNHLECLKSKEVKYFPVSHAWHQSIAEAYALRLSNPSAAKASYEVPVRTLLAIIQRFGPDMHLWHDYISIPQWQDKFRGTTILPQIFDIFKESGCAVIHLGLDLPAEIMKPTFNPEALNQQVSSLQRLFNAHWFSRMWPVIEFDRAGDAYIMSGKYEIMPNKFSTFVKQVMEANGASFAQSSAGSLKWIEDLPLFVKERQKNKCLGYVFDMISDQGCRSFRDKFIGASELLEVTGYPALLPPVPQDACLWLSERRLESNDFSPLLLRPSDEPKYKTARWLKGHTVMTAGMWGLGVQTQPARVVPSVKDHAVYLELELVGNITDTFSWEAQAGDDYAGFSEVLKHLVSMTGGSAAELVKNLERIYPSRFFWTESSRGHQFPDLQYGVPSGGTIDVTLRNLLERFTKTVSKGDTTELKSLRKTISAFLELSTPPLLPNSGSFANVDRLQLYSRLCDSSECTLISVSCPSCDKTSAFRATVWQKPRPQAQLYLIPGLGYQYSIPGGMGMIVDNEEVVGRVRFGSPACNCKRSATVKLT
ncbi:hypothetical protein K432DRAFT_300828 [Lepidopterella palustris CBS 459.81]|uniref:Heterokaryon incompatibility domain-containing protein n=1 Tax=Lepidopterella palustris CBS 459.81 TaxID=1314670 RepID=A0A8E2JDX2_9PEZI|nr:hypothetical protein K432DRAFT_300828 [Lepidopterella palustris CBS 459.81]